MIAFDLVRTEVLDITCSISNKHKIIQDGLDFNNSSRNASHSRNSHIILKQLKQMDSCRKMLIKLMLRTETYNLLVQKIRAFQLTYGDRRIAISKSRYVR